MNIQCCFASHIVIPTQCHLHQDFKAVKMPGGSCPFNILPIYLPLLKTGCMSYINSEVERADRLIIDTKSEDKWAMR